MTSFLRSDRSRPVAIWLLVVAALVLGMVVVGGATRLTGSGLSITEWKPIHGVVPPLTLAEWQAEFAAYKAIPQYQFINRGMSLGEFQQIYWWEWAHRLLGRVLGLVFFVPFVWFAARRQIPKRLTLRLAAIFVLGGLQGVVGWWMVASGLADRVYVAPERLMIHLGLAFALLAALVWTALDAWSGGARQTLPSPWGKHATALVVLIYVQVLLGALVAGNHAGLIYTDWPLFNGKLIPEDYAGPSFWATMAHSQGAVQLHHRLMGYLVTGLGVAAGIAAWRSRELATGARQLGAALGGLVLLQMLLGIATLMTAVPIGLGLAHQILAAITLCVAVAFGWRVRRT
jgi:cytochrome c oxidase assembly protein subunit 15